MATPSTSHASDLLPAAFPDEATPDPVPRMLTVIYGLGQTLRMPAVPLRDRFPIFAGCELGAPVDVIAASIAAGGRWRVGRAQDAVGDTVIWLSELDLPFEQTIAAWWVGGPDDSHPMYEPARPRSVVSG